MATPMDTKTLVKVTQYLVAARWAENIRYCEIYEYYKNRVIDIYVPKRATAEYRQVVDQSRFNVLPILETSLANKLYVDGYRGKRQKKNAKVWDTVWQPNRMDARQAGIWRSALRYGLGYNTVLPGRLADQKNAVITPWSPRRLTALYQDPLNDEWPLFFMTVGTPYPTFADGDGPVMVTPVAVYDHHHRYRFDLPAAAVQLPLFSRSSTVAMPSMETVQIDTARLTVDFHGMQVPPVVRYLQTHGDLDDGPEGVLYPMLPAQRSLNQTTFGLKMAEIFQIFRQRYVTGIAIDEDEDGKPLNPFNAGADELWQAEGTETKFGELAQADMTPYLSSRDSQLAHIASTAHLPPHTVMIGDTIANVNAEALAMLQSEHAQDVAALRASLGEGAEQTMRLAGLAMGDQAAWEDTSSQVRWRDTTPRSLAQVADALGKLAQMLGVPARGLWERIPDVTDQDLELWEDLAKSDDSFAKLAELEGRMNDARTRRPSADHPAPAPTGRLN